ncbi:alpha/beta fold hydrolase [Protofrankia symbiont of Coriaria ruscifolia]|uniref:alpha/beta fold hydrolase n=1 Tax=Protofrankia symbiont of Coriaria ruscifolia TaxID=1306542 RepID=UPI001041304C|nr:alpha/beta hydrolase [Protofrankia symbiont of Coriaria ruscifolia]
MGTVQANGIEIAYELHGDSGGLPLVLVGELGQQLVGWHPDLIRAMVRRGFQVVVYDNRDVGLSTHFDHLGQPDLVAAMSGDTNATPYTLADMAADAIGLMDAIGWQSAHVFGISMGGMIAQTAALRFPDRVRSLTSVSVTTGNHGVGQAAWDAAAVVLRPVAASREAHVDGAEQTYNIIGSAEFPHDRGWIRERAGLAWDRRYDPHGTARQLIAILVAEDRTPDLARLEIPTLVVHGTNDLLVPVAGGRLTAAAIPSAELLEIDGMSHDIPRQVWDRLLDKLDDVAHRGEAATTARQATIPVAVTGRS